MPRFDRRAAFEAKRRIPDHTPLTADDLELAASFAGAQPFEVHYSEEELIAADRQRNQDKNDGTLFQREADRLDRYGSR